MTATCEINTINNQLYLSNLYSISNTLIKTGEIYHTYIFNKIQVKHLFERKSVCILNSCLYVKFNLNT